MSEKNTVRFDDRVAVVTGGGRGLGRTYAIELAKRKAKVVVNDFGGPLDDMEPGSTLAADRVVDEIRALGGEAVASYESVVTYEGGQAVIDKAIEAFGRVDILINNAGIHRPKNMKKVEPEDWDMLLAVHLTGAYNVTRPAFLGMRENNYGRIVMTTSDAGLFGTHGQVPYGAAKMGLVGFMNALKLEGEKFNVKVNTISPIAYTRLSESFAVSETFVKMAKTDYVAAMVLCLCSEQCPVTGSIYYAGMGHYRRVAVVAGPGAVVGDDQEIPTPEKIYEHWEAINRLDHCKEFYNTSESLEPIFKVLGISSIVL
jgi:NAD(P)-dependent dehydrogenase (short-subunit alcohol dehydrogenase family)